MIKKVVYSYNKMRNNLLGNLDRISNKIKFYSPLFFIYLGIGLMVYFMLMSQNLVNAGDGIVKNSVAYAGTWERSIGRWFWPILDKIRFGIVSSPLNTIITLILFSIGCVLLIDLFKLENKLQSILVGALIIVNPLVCDSLTYSYMSVTFGLAFLLSIISAYCVIKIPNIVLAVISGAIFLAFSMGNYQAYFGVTCLIFLVYFMKSLLMNVNIGYTRSYIFKIISSILIGGVLYQVFLNIVNNHYNITMAAYKNAGNISFKSIILNLPQRMIESYKEFYQFFFTNKIQMTDFGLKKIYLVAFVIMAVTFAFIIYKIFKKNIINGCLMICSVIILPLGSNAILLITESPNNMLTTGGLTLLFPLSLCLLGGGIYKTVLNILYFVSLSAILWINICIVSNDQVALMEGRNSTITIAGNIISSLLEQGYINNDTEIAFVGRPSDNILFTKTYALNRANGYAKFGENWYNFKTAGSANIRVEWKGLFVRYFGLSLNLCSAETYSELVLTNEVHEMPSYPDEGSIMKVNEVVVVKVSDTNY